MVEGFPLFIAVAIDPPTDNPPGIIVTGFSDAFCITLLATFPGFDPISNAVFLAA